MSLMPDVKGGRFRRERDNVTNVQHQAITIRAGESLVHDSVDVVVAERVIFNPGKAIQVIGF